jgi:polyisoprenoid-binding protein YceI
MTSPNDSTTADSAAGSTSWQLDPASSSVAFEHKTIWGLVTVRGTFTGISGSGEIAADGSARGQLEIDAASLDTKHGQRDKHLRSADFFGAESHPKIVAELGPVVRTGDAAAEVSGTLTVAGVTRPIALTAAITEETDQAITLTASGEFDRADYGMSWNMLGMVKGHATVSVVARFTRPASAGPAS